MKSSTRSIKPAARRNARYFALQAIYSWQISGANVADIQAHFLMADNHEEEEFQAEEPRLRSPESDVAYFNELLTGVVLNYEELDTKMRPFLSRPLRDLDEMEHALLRLAMYELCKRDDIPFKVAINESIELAKRFGAEDSHKFVNGVLDKVVISLNRKKVAEQA